ncbi:recombination endonuclease subunit [Caulobacter phage Cr30]|uniref:recombination endonuclease subunit n=1 Tax=Caulobacter phage Cr30 TaxID=1357714 RepID=UPI0004A9BB65|nr:recombination endonuclease subunit [Caulobacter phage Cr30]AGS81033.1 recombination endonuclease subunit [Caulobacter phage Cr30]
MSIGEKSMRYQLDAHATTLIHGRNGSNKSGGLLDPLSFVLYKKPFRNINKGQLINSINKKDCKVEVTFSIGKNEYLVRRGMAPEIFEIWENGVLLKNPGTFEYQEHLEKRILRMNHKSFCQIVIIGTATFVPFMKLGSGGRREIIEDLLDLQVFSKMNRLLRDRVDENKNALSEIRYESDLIEEKIRLQKQFIQNSKNAAKVEKDSIREKIEETSLSIEEFQKKIQTTQKQIDNLQNSIQDQSTVSKKIKQYSTVEAQLRERKSKLKKELKFFHDYDHCPTCKQDIDETFKCDSVSKKEKKIQEIENGLEKLSEDLTVLSNRSLEIQNILAEINGLTRTISDYNSTINGFQKFIVQLEKELNSETKSFTEEVEQSKLEELYSSKELLDKRREELVNQKATYDVASVLLKDGGIKSKIIKQYIPIINGAINKYLNILDLNVQFEIDETFKETLKSRFRENFSYESFSEGEKARINMALIFAWRYVATMRNSSATNLLILDEVADGGVDNEGIDDLVKILHSLEKTHVFVISHRESMMDKFEHTIKIEKVKNFSRFAEE